MKAIQLQENLIIKEVMKQVERESNRLHIEYRLYPKFGSTHNEETQRYSLVSIGLEIEKSQTPVTWASLKDASNDEIMTKVFNTITLLVPLYVKEVEWLDEKQKAFNEGREKEFTEKVTETDNNGETVTVRKEKENPYEKELSRYRDESEESCLSHERLPTHIVHGISRLLVEWGFTDTANFQLITLDS